MTFMTKRKSYDEDASEDDLTTVFFEDEVEEGDSGDVVDEPVDEPEVELLEVEDSEAPKDQGVVFTGTDKNGRLVSG